MVSGTVTAAPLGTTGGSLIARGSDPITCRKSVRAAVQETSNDDVRNVRLDGVDELVRCVPAEAVELDVATDPQHGRGADDHTGRGDLRRAGDKEAAERGASRRAYSPGPGPVTHAHQECSGAVDDNGHQ